jgi:hypothetical protein
LSAGSLGWGSLGFSSQPAFTDHDNSASFSLLSPVRE